MDWSYAAEGGKNVIFQYVGGPECCVVRSRRVLRVVKSELAAAAATIDIDPANNNAPLAIERAPESRRRREKESASRTFQRRIVRPLLGRRYVDLARTVRLPTAAAARLYRRAMTSGSIPPSRLPDWQMGSGANGGGSINDDGGGGDGVVMASLLRDYKQLPPPPPRHLNNDENGSGTTTNTTKNDITMSIEIKPKAGYITTSPLVHPNNRCKYKHTRYALQQRLMHRGHVTKGWQQRKTRGDRARRRDGDDSTTAATSTTEATNAGALFVPSDYSPSDLFSGRTMRVRRAIANLCDNAQNNLRVFVDGEQIPLADGGGGSSSSDDRGEEEEDDREKLLSDGDYDTMMNKLVSHYYYSSNDGSSGDDDNSMVSSQTMTTTTTKERATNEQTTTKKERTTKKKKTTFLTMIIDIITTILDRESDLLSNMLLIQQLDIIDGDGAVLIYDRLVYLCNGSYDIADGLLDDAAILPAYDFMPTATTTTTTTTEDRNNNNNNTTAQQRGINASPYAFPECNNLDELLNVILQFQSLLREQQQQQRQQEMDDVTVMIDTYHSKCIELVNCLSKEACIYLLTNWLLSSALCDISFFVTFQLLTVEDCNVNEVRQSCDTGGIALCNPLENYELDSTTDHTTTTGTVAIPVHYEVKVVDCDPKPARKLRERKHVESKFHLIDEKNDIV